MRERYKEGSLRTAKNILSVIEKAKDNDELILVFPHRSVDGDCVGSSSGIVSIVRSLGVDAYVAIPEELPENMGFLGIDEYLIQPDSVSEKATELNSKGTVNGKKPGAVIATDISESSRMGICGAIFESVDTKIIIDHHASVTTRSDNMWIDPDSSSASEMVFYVAEQVSLLTGKDLKDVLAPNAVKAVLAGIVTDTGRFTFTNTHPETLETAGALMDLGGNISEVCYNLFDRKSKPKFRLSAKARSEVKFYCDDKFALTVVPYEQFKEFGAGPDGVDDVVSAMRDIDGVELAIVLRELENGDVRGNIRSQEYFDCCKFAEGFGGGGHVRAAGFNAKGDINEIANEVIKRVQDIL
ncbi:phosphoesterase RecJ-like protein [Ruminococcaceae bacterium R-25]|nr:phosphoesterase RecJ-like protein [Ruminococcaceae bacterium R-25]SUQ11924.1 phosphoesterase RecJ domain-containing protein [Oscillospiraceae bacterium]